MKLTEKDIMVLCVVTFVPIFAFLDFWLMGFASPMQYLLVCAVEMGLFAGGYLFARVEK